jgi:4-hydroxy-tetrahydrodipicolinate synthase
MVPILTPLNADESVDIASLRRLVNYLLDNGVHGIWVSGTTGEFASLPDRECIVSMETVVDEVAGRVPIIGNVSGASTRLSLDKALAVQESGLDGIAATPPYYYPNSQDELLDHYRYLRDRAGLPLWVYNIPQTVKTAVAPGTISKLAGEDVVVGVKDSSGAGEWLAELNVLCDQGGVELYRFLGTMFRVTSSGATGAHGVIPGIANLVPAIASRGWEAGERGDVETVRECEQGLALARKVPGLAKGGSQNAATLASMKSALKLMGVIDHDAVTRPLRPLSDGEKGQLRPILKELGLLN